MLVTCESATQTDSARLLAACDAASAAMYPLENRRGVGVEVLDSPSCRFFVARENGVALGCGGVVFGSDGTAEVKRLFVEPLARCRGVARRLLQAIEVAAREAGTDTLLLETPVSSHAAIALYRRLGFLERARFGSDPTDPLGVIMEKRL